MSNYYSEQENKASEFAELSGLPFVYEYTGGGFCAMSADTATHRVYITNDDGSMPNVGECHYVGVYLIADDDLMGEIFPRDRADLLATVDRVGIKSVNDLVDFVLECGRFAPDKLGA